MMMMMTNAPCTQKVKFFKTNLGTRKVTAELEWLMAFQTISVSYLNTLIPWSATVLFINPLNPELNPICYLLALLGAHHFLHVSRIRVKLLTFRRLMSYIHGAPILDVSRSHTTTQHSR